VLGVTAVLCSVNVPTLALSISRILYMFAAKVISVKQNPLFKLYSKVEKVFLNGRRAPLGGGGGWRWTNI
jgi:hypothetical protein